jgi:hypothetical protein
MSLCIQERQKACSGRVAHPAFAFQSLASMLRSSVCFLVKPSIGRPAASSVRCSQPRHFRQNSNWYSLGSTMASTMPTSKPRRDQAGRQLRRSAES